MKLEGLRRLFKNDFDEENQDLIEEISIPVNQNIEVLFNALQNNVDLKNNMYGDFKTLTVTVDSNGNPLSTVSYQSTLPTTTLGIAVIRAVNTTNSAVYPTGAPFLSFSQSGKTITINNVTGLPVGNTFTLTVFGYG